ncbi:ADP-ribosylation factor family-domain-containing protein, partial [Baffinella frigidus]
MRCLCFGNCGGIFDLFKPETHALVLVGLDAAGKTTWLYRLQTGEHVRTNPTIVSNFEEVLYKNIRLSLWDLGGQAAHRGLWKYHFAGSKGLLFALDSSDRNRQRIVEARRELFDLLDDAKLSEAVLMVLANKQDVPNAMTAEEVAEALGLSKRLGPHRKWYVQPCSALCGEGITEAMDWIIDNIGKNGHHQGGHDSARHFPTSGVNCAEQWRSEHHGRSRGSGRGEGLLGDQHSEPSTRSLLGTKSAAISDDEDVDRLRSNVSAGASLPPTPQRDSAGNNLSVSIPTITCAVQSPGPPSAGMSGKRLHLYAQLREGREEDEEEGAEGEAAGVA